MWFCKLWELCKQAGTESRHNCLIVFKTAALQKVAQSMQLWHDSQAMAAVEICHHTCFAHKVATSLLSRCQGSTAAVVACRGCMQDDGYMVSLSKDCGTLWPDLYCGPNKQHRGIQLLPVHGSSAVVEVSCHSNSIQLLPTRLICLYTHTTATLILHVMCMFCLDRA